jgi:hypothetical protein
VAVSKIWLVVDMTNVCVRKPETDGTDEGVPTVVKDDPTSAVLERLFVLTEVVAKANEERVPFPGANQAVDSVSCTDIVGSMAARVVM